VAITRLKDLANDLAEILVEENYKIIYSQTKNLGPKETRFVVATFISRMVHTMVYSTLHEEQKLAKSDKDRENLIFKNLAEVKTQVQNAVAAGFQNPMSEFSGQPVEYYCQIKLVPEPTSNKIN